MLNKRPSCESEDTSHGLLAQRHIKGGPQDESEVEGGGGAGRGGGKEGAGEAVDGAEEEGDGEWVTVSDNAFGAFLHVSLQVTSDQ